MCDRQPQDAGEGFDLMGHCTDKLDFLAGIFAHGRPEDQMTFGPKEISGLFWVLDDLRRDLEEAEAVVHAELKRWRA